MYFLSCLGRVKPERLLKPWGHVLIASIQEMMPMIETFLDFTTVFSFIVFIMKKIIETVPPRLLEVFWYKI